MTDIPSYDMSLEDRRRKWQRNHLLLIALNVFLCGFLLGICTFWYAVEYGHYRPNGAEAQDHFAQPTK